MRIVIIGGGIAAVYLANNIKKLASDVDVLIVSDEAYSPYDRIHLCALSRQKCNNGRYLSTC